MIEPFRIQSSLVGDFGGLSFPINPADFDGTLTPLDPARTRLAALFKAALNYELGGVWKKLTGSATPLSDTLPVMSVFEMDPNTHNMKQVGLKYPVLCLHRVGEQTWSDYTMQVSKCDQDWNLHYILPNLDIGEMRRIADVLRIIPEIIRRVIRARGHISFEDGELQFEKCGLGSVHITKSEFGQAKFGGQVESPEWPAVTVTIHTVEYGTDDEDEYPLLAGIDWNIGVGDSTGIQPNIIENAIDV